MTRRSIKLGPDQRKLVLSLGANVLTRIPGAAGVVFFLPLIRFGLGTDDYAALLASISLGAAGSFLFGGFSLIGRRLIGEAHARDDRDAEADGFASLFAAALGAFAIAVCGVVAYQAYERAGIAITIVSLVPILGAFLNTFDNIRAAYNEHYVTATLQVVFQVSLYAIGFTVAAIRHDVVLAALVMTGHLALASIVAGGLLLRRRPYLARGRPAALRRIVTQGTRLALADGVILTTLSLAVVWLHAVAPAATSAWFATVARIFQIFLVPVLLLLMPLSSYVRLLWDGMTWRRQRFVVQLTLGLGTAYGLAIAVAMALLTELYVSRALHLSAPGGLWQLAAISLLFAGIIAYKSYSSIAYLILDVSHLSFWTSVALAAAVAIAVAVSPFVKPFDALAVYAAIAGAALLAVLFWSAGRFHRTEAPAEPAA